MDGYLKKDLDFHYHAVTTKNTSIVYVIDGRSGMGKTTIAIQIAKHLDPNFDLPQIYYTPEEFLLGLSEAKPGSFHLFDEAMVISSRASMSKINIMIIQAMSMIRSKKIFIGFCVNSIFDLDRNLALHRCDYLINVYGANIVDRGKFKVFYKAKDKRNRILKLYLNGKATYDYDFPRANFFGRFTKAFLVNEKEYEKRKQEGINRFLEISSTPRENIAVRARNRLVWYAKDVLKLKWKDISKITGMSIDGLRSIQKKYNGDPNQFE